MDNLVVKTKGKLTLPTKKNFEKVGLPETVKTNDVEELISRM